MGTNTQGDLETEVCEILDHSRKLRIFRRKIVKKKKVEENIQESSG